jgi:tRNA (guanine-N7-)-methyltransferase
LGRKKLERFKDNAERSNVIEIGKPNFGQLIGKWKSDYFGNLNELVVELGCGRGEYAIGLGQQYVHQNFVGIDIKGSRIWVGSGRAIKLELSNVAFLRTQIELLDAHFAENELDEVWITFPDPRPKDKDENKRLTSSKMLLLYQKLLKDNGWVKFKTDSTFLFDYTLDLLAQDIKVKNLVYTRDLYNSAMNEEHFGLKTKYEQIFTDKGEKIKYLKFQFDMN